MSSLRLVLLLGCLDGLELPLTALLVGLGTGLGVQEVVPPAEAGGVVSNELLVMHIVVVGTSPEGQDVAQAPGEVETAVCVDGLEEAEDDPDVHGDEVQVASDGEEENGRSHDTHTEEHGLDRRGVFSS